jgi:putative toxin-antitoxin system antitoxin component (TIGR02293 family)
MTAHATAAGTKRKPVPSAAIAKPVVTSDWPADASSAWFVRVFAMPAIERVAVAKRGVPAASIAGLARATGESKERVIALLGLSRATVDRKARASQALSVVESERVIGFARLVGQAQAMVDESGGSAGFDSARWVAGWLEQPMPALGGLSPGEYMDTAEGQQIVSGLLERARGGAYA